MPQVPSENVTALLRKWKAGDQHALQTLVPLVYKELHDLAHYCLQRERPEHTLQSTALVHEAYLRLVNQSPFETEDRAHFLAIAARLMRQILVDYARGHGAAKRGADCTVQLGEINVSAEKPVSVVALDDALTRLAELDPQQCRIVELRYFGGMTVPETAAVLGISPATVKREWAIAKAWLSREMRRRGDGKGEAVGKG